MSAYLIYKKGSTWYLEYTLIILRYVTFKYLLWMLKIFKFRLNI